MRRLIVSLGMAAALVLGACRTPQQETFYTLNPLPQPLPQQSTADASRNDARFTVAVGPVKVPEMVDRPQLVVRRSPNRVDVLEQHRWAQPLPAEIARVVAADLASRLRGAQVVSSGDLAIERADFRVALDIEQFDAIPGQGVTVQAAWSVRRAGSTLHTARSTLREPTHADDYEALAAAYARALANLSAEVARTLQSLPAKP